MPRGVHCVSAKIRMYKSANIVDCSDHGVVHKVVKAYGRETFRFLGVGIMVTIPFDKKSFNVNNDFTINFTENEKKL